MLDLSAFQTVNITRCRKWEATASRPWSIAERLNALCGEAGEAANVAKKILRHDLGMIGNVKAPTKESRQELCEMLGDELADIVIYASITADELGIDLGERIRQVFNRKSEQLGFEERA